MNSVDINTFIILSRRALLPFNIMAIKQVKNQHMFVNTEMQKEKIAKTRECLKRYQLDIINEISILLCQCMNHKTSLFQSQTSSKSFWFYLICPGCLDRSSFCSNLITLTFQSFLDNCIIRYVDWNIPNVLKWFNEQMWFSNGCCFG